MKKTRERYKRLVKLFFASMLLLGLCTLYGITWVEYYNRYVLQNPFYRRGNWLIILLYGVLLAFFLNTYGGFKIGYFKNGNLIYSQVMAVIFTNCFTYAQIAIIDKRFVNPAYILVMTLVGSVFIVLWTMIFQWLYKRAFPPRKMLFVKGDRRDYHLRDKINARDDKYEICEVIHYKRGTDYISSRVKLYDGVIIGDMPSHERNQLLKYCFAAGIRTYSVPKISDVLLRSCDELNLFDTPLLLSRNIGLTVEQQFAKRMEDLIMASVLLILFAPVFLIASAAIKCSDGGSVFYKQERLTKDGQRFMIYKFRTMVENAEQLSGPTLASERDPRILPVGRILRATRLDELPQVLNILRGEMSVVGPRPERPELAAIIEKNIPEFPLRLKVKAGLTGYAQVYGKYNTTAYDKLKLDLMYIRKFSLLMDLKLIIMTPKIMLLKESTEGVADPDVVTGSDNKTKKEA